MSEPSNVEPLKAEVPLEKVAAQAKIEMVSPPKKTYKRRKYTRRKTYKQRSQDEATPIVETLKPSLSGVTHSLEGPETDNRLSGEEAFRQEMELLHEELSKEPLAWALTFCKNHHSKTTPVFHLHLMDALLENRHVVIAAPRGFAKSTIVNFDYVFHSVIFKKKRFIVIISNPYKKGASFLDAIKKELGENDDLKNSYPGIRITRDAEGDSIFTHPDGFETRILCKGVDQIGSIRGLKFKFSRPDLIICDDIEDDELVKNPERRTELQKNYDEAVVPAGEYGKTQYVFIGTVMHDDSQLAKMLASDKYTEYKKLIFRALNEKNESIWAENMSAEDLIALSKEKPTVFAKEFQNDPASGSNVRFDKKDFRYWRREDHRYLLFDDNNSIISTGKFTDCRAAIACDLAWKEKRSSDSTVIMPGILTPDNYILLENYVEKKGMRPDEFIEQVHVMVDRLQTLTGSTVPVGFEKAMLEQVTQWFFRRDMKVRNKYILTKELLWDADKETRIEIRLAPRYAQHVIFHKQGMGDLEHQLLRFPSATHDDLVDSLQGLVQLLQFPKNKKEESSVDDLGFQKLRQFAIDSKKETLFHGFGQKGKDRVIGIRARKTLF